MSLNLFTISADNAKAAPCFFYLKEDNKMNAVVFQIKVNKMPRWCIGYKITMQKLAVFTVEIILISALQVVNNCHVTLNIF